MITALVGAQSTGKTTISRELQRSLPGFAFFAHNTKHQVQEFGYRDIHQLIGQVGAGVFEVISMNAWVVTDASANNMLPRSADAVLNQSVIENYAYFLALGTTEADRSLYTLVHQMAKYYTSLIDQFIYFPVGNDQLDEKLLPYDQALQKAVDQNIWRVFRELGVSEDKIHMLDATDINGRVTEILGMMPLSPNWTQALFAQTLV